MHHERLTVSREDTVGTVTIDRADRRNALDRAMWQGLADTMRSLSADSALRCVVLRGAGTAAFCAGADISRFDEEWSTRELSQHYGEAVDAAMEAVRGCQHPVIAMLHGACLGGGAGLALACDFRVAGEALRFGITARNLGIFYPYSQIAPIIHVAGSAVAAEVLIEGRVFDGRTALAKGLVSRLVPDDQLEAETLCLARTVAAGAPLSARFHKKAIRRLAAGEPADDASADDAHAFIDSEDFRSAYKAFLDKRQPVFVGR